MTSKRHKMTTNRCKMSTKRHKTNTETQKNYKESTDFAAKSFAVILCLIVFVWVSYRSSGYTGSSPAWGHYELLIICHMNTLYITVTQNL